MNPQPQKLNIKRDQGLEIIWQDGSRTWYPLAYLRSMCPCAGCRDVREKKAVQTPGKLTHLPILPGNYAETVTIRSAARVGNYAIQIEWSDNHSSGIYSFVYLHEIRPPAESSAT